MGRLPNTRPAAAGMAGIAAGPGVLGDTDSLGSGLWDSEGLGDWVELGDSVGLTSEFGVPVGVGL